MVLYNHSKGENKNKKAPTENKNQDKDSLKNQKGITKMANKNNTNTTRFTVDFINKKISGTKASFDKAGKGNGPIYDELAALTANHPNFELVIVEQKKKIVKETKKATYNGMTIDFMRDYLMMNGKTKELKTLNQVIAFAENSNRSKYPLAKKYFLKQFPKDSDDKYIFDFDKAMEAVEAYRINNEKVEDSNVPKSPEAEDIPAHTNVA